MKRYWDNMIINNNDAIMLAKRIKFFMGEGIPYEIDFCKGIAGETLINLKYLVPEEGLDMIKMYSIGKEAV